MNEPEPSQQPSPQPIPRQVRDEEFARASHDYLFNRPTAGDQEPDLTSGFVRQLSAGPGQFRGDHLINRNPPTVQMLQPEQLVGLQAADVSVDGWNLASSVSPVPVHDP
jgi:hypothetical protein